MDRPADTNSNSPKWHTVSAPGFGCAMTRSCASLAVRGLTYCAPCGERVGANPPAKRDPLLGPRR